MNKNGIVAVVVVITAVVLVGLWVMRSGQTRPGGRQFDCAAPPSAPTGLAYTKSGNVINGTWTAPVGADAPTTYVVEAGSRSGLNDQGTYVVPATQTSFGARHRWALSSCGFRAQRVGTSPASNEVHVLDSSNQPPDTSGIPHAVASSRCANSNTCRNQVPTTPELQRSPTDLRAGQVVPTAGPLSTTVTSLRRCLRGPLLWRDGVTRTLGVSVSKQNLARRQVRVALNAIDELIPVPWDLELLVARVAGSGDGRFGCWLEFPGR